MPESQIDEQVLAQNYGFAYSVLQSDPELAGLFKQAVAETWTGDRFAAAVRGTKWFQQHSDSWRNAQLLRSTDPKTYSQNVGQVKAYMLQLGAEMGLNLAHVIDVYAETAYQYSWDSNQIRANLARFVKTTDGQLWGQIGQAATEIRQRAFDQGISLDEGTVRRYAQNVAGGQAVLDDYMSKIDNMAASAFPHLAERIKAGETISEISSPYRQTMAALLEMNPDGVGVSDPMIKQALASKDKDGKPVLKTLWEFENDVRKDSRWNKTQNAQDAAMETTNRVLRDWGLIG